MAMPIFTEEAKANSSVCPLTLSPVGSPVGCIGKTCMAWRFATTNIKDPTLSENFTGTVRSDDTHGYCGMAGVPGVLFGERS